MPISIRITKETIVIRPQHRLRACHQPVATIVAGLGDTHFCIKLESLKLCADHGAGRICINLCAKSSLYKDRYNGYIYVLSFPDHGQSKTLGLAGGYFEFGSRSLPTSNVTKLSTKGLSPWNKSTGWLSFTDAGVTLAICTPGLLVEGAFCGFVLFNPVVIAS